MYHFFVEENQIKDSRIYVNGADYNHVRNVIRLKHGDSVLISVKNNLSGDLSSGNYMCELEDYTDDEAVFDITQGFRAGLSYIRDFQRVISLSL